MTTPPALHSSTTQEHLTPADVVEAGRATLGGFDLDPATTPFANELVQATKIYTRADDGLVQPWHGRVFLNPPGGSLDEVVCGTRSNQALWWGRLASAWASGEVEAAIFVGFSLELLQAAQSLVPAVPQPLDFPVCIPKKRIKFDVLADDLLARLRAEYETIPAGKVDRLARMTNQMVRLEQLRGQRVSGDQPTHGNIIVGVGVRDLSAFNEIGYVRY